MKYSTSIIKQGSVMFIAVAVFNFLSLLYQLYMVRNLEAIDYGVLNSLFSILMIVSIPSGTLQTVITKFVSAFYANNHHARINFLLRSFIKKISVFGLIIFLILLLGSRPIASFLRIDSPVLISILGVVTFFSIILPLAQGALQGLQRFEHLGLVMVTNGGLKLILGILFVSIGFGVTGAMSALVISTSITLLMSFIILASVLPRSPTVDVEPPQTEPENKKSDLNFSEVYKYFFATAAVFLCLMVLTNIDVVLVKHFFEPLEAGYYSIAQMAGKIILFLPIAISMVIFPKASELQAQGKVTFHLLRKGLLCVVILCGTAALMCFLFPGLVIRLLSGEEHSQCITLVRIFSITMVFFALVYTLLFYHLSIHRLGFIYSLVSLTALQVLAIILFHKSLLQVLYIMCGNAVLLFLINGYLAFKEKGFHVTSGVDSNSELER